MLNASQGMTIYKGLTVSSGNITFPNSYSSVPGSTNLGYFNASYMNDSNNINLTNNVWTKIRSLVLTPGIYLASAYVSINSNSGDASYYSIVISNNDTNIDNEAYNYGFTYHLKNNGFSGGNMQCFRIISTTSTITISSWFNCISGLTSSIAQNTTHLKVIRLA